MRALAVVPEGPPTATVGSRAVDAEGRVYAADRRLCLHPATMLVGHTPRTEPPVITFTLFVTLRPRRDMSVHQKRRARCVIQSYQGRIK
jgi:hypothetical protein